MSFLHTLLDLAPFAAVGVCVVLLLLPRTDHRRSTK